MSAEIRYLPAVAAVRVAELEQKLERAEFAAKTNAETICEQRKHIRELERKLALVTENSNAVDVIKENATDLLTAALVAANDIRVTARAKRYICAVLGHKAVSPMHCHERKPRLQVMEETWSLRDVLCDYDAMPAREQAALLIGFAFGERAISIRCTECEELNSECICQS